LEKALKNGYLTNFPGLNAQSLRKFPPASVPMAKGHLDQTCKSNDPLDRAPASSQTAMTLSTAPTISIHLLTPPKPSNVTAPSQSPLDKSILTRLDDSSCRPVLATTI
jgi:hypothetical protein